MIPSKFKTVIDVRRSARHLLSAIALKREPRFVILGTGRSGSGYISRVLTAAGIPCGHESWWNPHGRRQRGLVGDSSWCALALIDWNKYTGNIFHQVRHPLDVISSYVHRQSFTSPFAQLKLPLLADDPSGDPLRYGCRIWLDLNRRSTELTKTWWRVEDVDAQLVSQIATTVGAAHGNIEAAIQSVPNSYNSHGTSRRLSWNDLPRDLVGKIEAAAQYYGYSRDERGTGNPVVDVGRPTQERRIA